MASVNELRKRFFSRRAQPLNIDISFRCPLECPRCGRQRHFRNHGRKVPGKDMPLQDFEKVAEHFKSIVFCGQFSDPIHHTRFIDILKICREKKVKTEISTASSFKSKEWFIEAFQAFPKAEWIFGIDGLPHQSHQYRINQDGSKLFDIMVESKKYLICKPTWQYIIFSYNENQIDDAMELAKQHELNFKIINSARWENDNDPLKPSVRK